jgi:hypothetical protein
MRHLSLVMALIALAVTAPAAVAAAPTQSGRYVWCGDDGESYNGSAGAYDVRAKRTSCTTARWVGRRWYERAWDEQGFPRQVGQFRCRALEPRTSSGVYIGKVLCTANGGKQAVRFSSTI